MVVSIAEAVRRIVSNSPCIMDCLKMDVVNYTALALRIQNDVSRALGGRKVKLEAIKMALIRCSEELRKEGEELDRSILNVIANTVLELKNDVALITVKQEGLVGKLDELMRRITSLRFLQLTQGAETFTIAIDQRACDDVFSLIGKSNVITVFHDQSAIILMSPKEIITTPGVISYITSTLLRNGVNITQIISCYVDTILIVSRADAIRAYEVLERKIIEVRNSISGKHQSITPSFVKSGLS
jgi:aspartokinase